MAKVDWNAIVGDHSKYYEFPLKWPDALKQSVPPGEPIYLHFVHWLSPSYRALPWIDYALTFAALAYLASVLKRHISFKLNCAVILGLLLSPIIRPNLWNYPYNFSESERVAFPFLIASFASILAGDSITAGVMTFLSYIIRPAFLAIIPFAVIISPRPRLVAAILIPLLAWCTFRWWAVGDFALVSNGAFQAITIYGPMVVPGDSKSPLARAIVTWKAKEKSYAVDNFIDRESDTDFYRYRYMGMRMQGHQPFNSFTYLNTYKDPVERNRDMRSLWRVILVRHWRERLMLYYRAWVLTLSKIPEPYLTYPLMLVVAVKYAADL